MERGNARTIADVSAHADRWSVCVTIARTSAHALRSIALATVFASAAILMPPTALAAENGNQDIDRSIKPGDDFYQYANGGWLKTVAIPKGQSSYDTRAKYRTSRLSFPGAAQRLSIQGRRGSTAVGGRYGISL